MAGWWKLIEVGACIEQPDAKVETGTWGYYQVTVPSTTPKEKLHEVATGRLLEKLDDVHVHHTWIQSVGKNLIADVDAEE